MIQGMTRVLRTSFWTVGHLTVVQFIVTVVVGKGRRMKKIRANLRKSNLVKRIAQQSSSLKVTHKGWYHLEPPVSFRSSATDLLV